MSLNIPWSRGRFSIARNLSAYLGILERRVVQQRNHDRRLCTCSNSNPRSWWSRHESRLRALIDRLCRQGLFSPRGADLQQGDVRIPRRESGWKPIDWCIIHQAADSRAINYVYPQKYFLILFSNQSFSRKMWRIFTRQRLKGHKVGSGGASNDIKSNHLLGSSNDFKSYQLLKSLNEIKSNHLVVCPLIRASLMTSMSKLRRHRGIARFLYI